MSICSLGAMGTEYIRDTPPISAITITEGSDETIKIEKIYSKLYIGNILDIKHRQSPAHEKLSWVSFDPKNNSAMILSPRGESSIGLN